MILVVGATGLLGSGICHRLSAEGKKVRALVRQTARPERLRALRGAGIELAWGDLKDEESLRSACAGIDAIISTASSTLSRQERDSIETVDSSGQSSLVTIAQQSGIDHFTFVSIPRSPVRESPLTRAKDRVEKQLAGSGMAYTILAANYFMEVWLSPALGFDYLNGKAVIFGEGRQLMGWVSYEDVAEVALRAQQTPGAYKRILPVGGPEDLSPLEVVQIFEEVTGRTFERQHVPEEALLAQLETVNDPLSETFIKLQLEYVHGCLMNTSDTLKIVPIRQKTVREYAESVTGSRAATV